MGDLPIYGSTEWSINISHFRAADCDSGHYLVVATADISGIKRGNI
jgi:hypothetical protein